MSQPTGSRHEALAHRLRSVLASHRAVREVRMFGGLSFMVDKRLAVAAGRDGDLLVRVSPAVYDELIVRGAVPAFMGPARSMGRGWVSVPWQHLENDDELAHWVAVGIDSRNAKS